MSQPGRHGRLLRCTFCSAGGSGEFAVPGRTGSVREQLEAGLALFGDKRVGSRYIAYYQSYTNTYGNVRDLERMYREAFAHPAVAGLSIATRPDCLPPEILALLTRLREEYAPKFLWVELGLQTRHDDTALLINRGYRTEVFARAMEALGARSIPVVVHLILGLPGETPARMEETVRYVNVFAPFGIKLQLLHVLRGTALAKTYGFAAPTDACRDFAPTGKGPSLHLFSLEEYVDTLIRCLELLSPDTVIHRLTGDGPRHLLLAPLWSLDKKNVLNTLHRTMKRRETYQGRLFR